mgnify:FL=1
MTEGDPFRCDWCNYSWRAKSDAPQLRCPSCGHDNVINEMESFKDVLGKENVLLLGSKKKKSFETIIEEQEEEVQRSDKSWYSKFAERIKKR